MMHEQAVVTQHQSTLEATSERAPPQQVAGIQYEENRPAVHTSVHQEQLVAGPVQQNVVEIPTVQEVVTYQDIPEVQVREMVQEVPQVVHEPFEQIVEQVVHVPTVIPQKRVQHRTVEQIVDVPVPMQVEEVSRPSRYSTKACATSNRGTNCRRASAYDTRRGCPCSQDHSSGARAARKR